MSETGECAEIRELIPEIAAGVAAGDERARALAHLGGCPECRRELAATADLVDEMLTLAPVGEPPAGFESRVMSRLAPEAKPRRETVRESTGRESSGRETTGWETVREPRWPRPRRPSRRTAGRLALWAATTAAVAGLAAGTVWWRTAQDRELAADYRHTLAVAHGNGLSAAPLMSTVGTETGTVFAYQGKPSWLYVTFRTAPIRGSYNTCLVTKDGRRFPLRTFQARPDSVGWGSTIRVPVEDISTLEFTLSGNTLMTARF
jgi:hypothetical protein